MRLPRRTGQASLFALIAVPVLLAAVVLVLVLIRQRDTATELRNAAVASALAAATELADDALLTDDPAALNRLLDRARRAAGDVGSRNLVEGKRLALALPADGKPGDVVFGRHTPGEVGSFRPIPRDASPTEWAKVDAVRLTARHPFREGVFTRVTAVIDRNVVGLRPLPDRPTPLVPVALYDGPHSDDRPAWTAALASGADEFALTPPGPPAFAAGQDGIREVRVRVGWQKPQADGMVCGFPLRLAGGSQERAVEQIATGCSAADFAPIGGEWKLDAGGTRAAAGGPELFRPNGEDRPLEFFRTLAATGDVRLWPVFREFAEDGTAIVIGFTAARVVAAERESDTGAVLLTLQPGVIATPTAVTHPDRPVRDRTVGRVRIAG